MQMRKAMNIFQTRGGCGTSDVDKGRQYGEETDDKKHQACVLPV